jgi:hypothetical protein
MKHNHLSNHVDNQGFGEDIGVQGFGDPSILSKPVGLLLLNR